MPDNSTFQLSELCADRGAVQQSNHDSIPVSLDYTASVVNFMITPVMKSLCEIIK
jgi:hypothetical protein